MQYLSVSNVYTGPGSYNLSIVLRNNFENTEDLVVYASGTFHVEFTIDGVSYPTERRGVSFTTTRDSIALISTQIYVDSSLTQVSISASVSYNGQYNVTDLGADGIKDTDNKAMHIASYNGPMLLDRPGNVVDTNTVQLTKLDYTYTKPNLVIHSLQSFAGSIASSSLDMTLFDSNYTQIMTVTEQAPLYGNDLIISLEQFADIETLYATVTINVTEEDSGLNRVTYYKGNFSFSISNEAPGIKVFLRESDYKDYGILYVKTVNSQGQYSYQKAKSFNML